METISKPVKSKKEVIDLLIGAVFFVCAIFAKGIGSLSTEMVKTIFLIITAVYWWVRMPIPIIATSLFVIAIQPMLNLSALNPAFTGLANPSHYFIIASFAFAIALQKTTVSNRLMRRLLLISKGNIKLITLMLMIVGYIISMWISNVSAVVLVAAFALDLSALITDEKAKRDLLRMLLIGIPFAAMLGGTATIVGSSINVLALNLLKQHAGIDVSFLQWFILGFPISVVGFFVCWFTITRVHKADDVPKDIVATYAAKLQADNIEKKPKNEIVILIILAAVMVTWVMSSWFTILDATIVAIIGMLLLFLPGVKAMSWKEFSSNMSWEIPIMGGATISLANLAVNHGLIDLIVGRTTESISGISLGGFILILGALVTVLLVAIPVGPAMVSMLIVPTYAMAQVLGFNPVVPIIFLGTIASNSSILPLNAVYLVAFTKGYWKVSELVPIGIITSIIWIAVAALWIPAVAGWFF